MPLARLEAELEQRFAGRVSAAVATPGDVAAAADLMPEERLAVAHAGAKRVREFTAGRVCARRLLEAYGVEDFALLSDADRVPRWPPGLVGSITHKADLCAVVVAERDSVAAVGIDVERDGAVEPRVWPRVCRDVKIFWDVTE